MNRQQRRSRERESKKYAMNKSDVSKTVRKVAEKELRQAYQDGMEEGINQAMMLLLTLPLEVLMDYYWPKSYAKRIPEFTNHVLEYFEKWQNGELEMDKLKEDLWEYGGVRLEVKNDERNRKML